MSDDHIFRLDVSMDDEVGMHVGQRTADLPNKQRYSFYLQPYFAQQLIFIEMLVNVLVSCVLQNKVNVVLIVKKSIEFSDMRMANE